MLGPPLGGNLEIDKSWFLKEIANKPEATSYDSEYFSHNFRVN